MAKQVFNFQIQFDELTDSQTVELLKQLKDKGMTNKQIFAFLTRQNTPRTEQTALQKLEAIVLEMLALGTPKISSYTLERAYIIKYGTGVNGQHRNKICSLYEAEILEHNNKLEQAI